MTKVNLNNANVKVPLAFFNNYTVFSDYVLSRIEKMILEKIRETAGWMLQKCKMVDTIPIKNVTVSLEYLKKETKVSSDKISETIDKLSERGILKKEVTGYILVLKGGM